MKKGKFKGIAVLMLLSLITTGCTVQGNAKSPETVIVKKDVQLESALADSKLSVARQDDLAIGVSIPGEGIREYFNGDRIIYLDKGKLNAWSMQNKTVQQLTDENITEISADGHWGLSQEANGQTFLHNLKNGEKQLIGKVSPEDITFIGNDLMYYVYETNTIRLLNVQLDELATWYLDGFEDFSTSRVTKGKDRLYTALRNPEGNVGIYRLAENGDMENIVTLAGEGMYFGDFTILQDGSVIFQGDYDGKVGIFHWNRETKEVQQLISGGEDSEGIWIPSYQLSPDESKIMFNTPVQVKDHYKTNVYVAEIINGKLTNAVQILENADLYAVISLSGHWSADSKMMYVTMTDEQSVNVDRIALFQLVK